MERAEERAPGEEMIGRHGAMLALLDAIRRAAPLDVPVIVQGPTGVGKELVAERLHALSGRRGGLVSVNVAGLPEQLAESELFGAARGAYTGAAHDRLGLVEASTFGTLYLDEAADLSPAIQAKLLRVLETGRVRRLGSVIDCQIRFRLVLSVQREPRSLVEAGRWREDFYYRVAGICLRVPTLAERASDIPALIDHFLSHLGREPLGGEGAQACGALLAHPWPGNVRELRRAVERAAFLAGEEPVTAEHILEAIEARDPPERSAGIGKPRTLREVERAHIEATLVAVGHDTKAAAQALGLSAGQLYRRFTLLGIAPPRRRRSFENGNLDFGE